MSALTFPTGEVRCITDGLVLLASCTAFIMNYVDTKDEVAPVAYV